jgi:hypothetical protein
MDGDGMDEVEECARIDGYWDGDRSMVVAV